MSDLPKYSELVTRLEFLVNHPVIDEEREEVCDLAAETIRKLERELTTANLALDDAMINFGVGMVKMEDKLIAANQQAVTALEQRNAEVKIRQAAEKNLAAANLAQEELRMQLVACGVSTLQNTPESAKERIIRDNPYWSESYGDVCIAIDREIAANQRAARAEKDAARYAGVLRVIATTSLYERSETRSELHDLIDAQRMVAIAALKAQAGGEG